MRSGRAALLLLVVLGLCTAVTPTGGPPTASASDGGEALLARFPSEFEGQPVDAGEHQPDWLLGELDGDRGDLARAALTDLLAAHARTLDDLAIAETELDRDPDFETVVVYSVPDVAGQDLLTGLLPAWTYWFDDPRMEQRTFGAHDALVISDGPGPLSYPAFHVLYTAGDLVFDISGTEPMLPSVLDWVAGWGTTASLATPIPSRPPPVEPSPPPNPTPEPATAADLIIADVTAGTIDAASGLLYRIQADFGDPALPARYAALPPSDDQAARIAAEAAFEELPPDIQQRLMPFLARPTDPTSVFHGAPATASAGIASIAGPPSRAAAADGEPSCGADGWADLRSTSNPVVVWARCDGTSGTTGMAESLAIVDGLWSPMVGLMGAPRPDLGGPAGGGDTSIDVYLIADDQCEMQVSRRPCFGSREAMGEAARTNPDTPGPPGSTSGYLLLRRARVGADPSFRAEVAHELFHILQYAHNADGLIQTSAIPGNGQWHWFVEASAKWAEHQFVPEARGVNGGTYVWFRAWQGTRVHGLTSPYRDDQYRGWVWPYFMEQEQGPAAIARAWTAMEGKQGWQQLDRAVSSIVPFDTRFIEFAVRDWNAPLPGKDGSDAIEPRFQTDDPGIPVMRPGDTRWTQADLGPLAQGQPAISEPVALEPLDIAYRQYSLAPDIQQLVLDFTGLAAAADLDVEALLHLEDGWTRRPLTDGTTRLCRERRADDADDLILVLANHATESPVTGAFTVEPLAEPCPEIFGTMTETQRWNKETYHGEWTATFNGSWERTPVDISYCDRGCLSFVPVGTVDWTWDSANDEPPPYRCHSVQTGSLPTGTVVILQDQMLYLMADDPDHLRYWGSGTLFMDPLACGGEYAGQIPSGFFWIQEADVDAPRSDQGTGARPQCAAITWRIDREATRITGSCWLDDLPGFEHRIEWDLERIPRT